MLRKIVGLLILGWGVLMGALAIAGLVFLILGGGGTSDLYCTGARLGIGIAAIYVGQMIYRRRPEQRP